MVNGDLVSTNIKMKKIGVLIRKVNIDNRGYKCNLKRNDLRKQLITLLKKLKKQDKELWIQYSIEKDSSFRFHIHLIVHYNHSDILLNQLKRFIGGIGSFKEKDMINEIKTIQGKYGEIDLHPVWNENGFVSYISKFGISEILF